MIKQNLLENQAKLVYLAIGSNLGNKIQNIEKVKYELEAQNIKINIKSSNFETESWPNKLNPKFVNAVIGVKSGYEKVLELVGVGFRANLKGDILNLQLGFSHDINFKIPNDVKIVVEKQTTLKISGSDKQIVGMVATKIKSLRRPEPYKGKGIREKGQYILRKEGKKK